MFGNGDERGADTSRGDVTITSRWKEWLDYRCRSSSEDDDEEDGSSDEGGLCALPEAWIGS